MHFKQRGASTIGTLIILIFGALLLVLAVKLIPIYLDDMTVANVLEKMQDSDELKGMPPARVKETMRKRFSVNNVEVVDVDDIHVQEDGGLLILDLNYEVRTGIFQNVDAVVSFSHHYELDTTK
ncbi:DUF4845 domain-containing protein [Marinobacteraceae bacterium S3BR75-40.1]